MLFVTGDCHGNFHRFSTRAFPIQKELSKQDFVVILGDAGLLWDGGKQEQYHLDWLEQKSFSVINVGGNHENYDLLEQYPKVSWHGGMAYQIRPSVLHLCRGYVYDLCGYSAFVMGGAQSHDMEVILPQGPGLSKKKRYLDYRSVPYRVYGQSWWPNEMPAPDDYAKATDTLLHTPQVDLVLTHCAPDGIQKQFMPHYPTNELTAFLQLVKDHLPYEQWFCGHYHKSWHSMEDRFRILYEEIIQVDKEKNT